MKKYIEYIGMAMVAVGMGVCTIVPMSYWASNPSLSQMEVFIDTWKSNLFGVIVMCAGYFVVEIIKRFPQQGPLDQGNRRDRA